MRQINGFEGRGSPDQRLTGGQAIVRQRLLGSASIPMHAGSVRREALLVERMCAGSAVAAVNKKSG